MVDARRGQRGVRRRHVDHPGLVLPQHHTVVGRAALAVLGQRVLHPGEALGDTGAVRGVGHIGRTVLQLQHQPVVAGVQRTLQRLGDVAGAAAVALDVGDLDAVDRHRRTVHLIAQAHALLQRSDQGEDLERRAGGQTGLSEVEPGGVGAAVVGLHPAGLRVDRHDRRAHVGVLALHVLVGGVDRGGLRLRVDGGGDLQTLGVQRLLVDVEDLEQLVDDLPLDQSVRPGGLVLCAGCIGRDGRREHLRLPVLLGQRPDLHHAVEHPVPPRGGGVRVDGRVQRRRPLDQRGQQRTLGHVELLDRLGEIRLRRRGHTVGPAAEVDDVQIGLQHLILGPFAGHLRRDHQLLGFSDQAADPGACVTDQGVLDVLLGDRRPALQVTAEDVVLGRAQEAGEREPRIRVEVAVLGGHHGVADVYRDLVDADVDPVALGRHHLGDLAAVTGQDRRHLSGADVPGFGDVDDHVRHPERQQRQHDQHHGRDQRPAAHPAPVDPVTPARAACRTVTARTTTAGRRGRGRGPLGRAAVERTLDRVDRVTQVRGHVVTHGRQDRGAPVIGCTRRTALRVRAGSAVPRTVRPVLRRSRAHAVSMVPCAGILA